MKLSREYQLINKAITGEIIILDLGRKGNVRAFVLTSDNKICNASTIKKFESFEEIATKYEFEYEWFKNNDYPNEYDFINKCYFTEKSSCGVGSDNRTKSTLKCEELGLI